MTSHSPPGLRLAVRGPRRGRLALGGAANTVLVIRGPEGAPLLPFCARGPAGRRGRVQVARPHAGTVGFKRRAA